MYLIVRCPKCGGLLLADTRYKTRTCPHCGRRMKISTLIPLARAYSPRDAVAIIQELKRREVRRGRNRYKKPRH
jgi:DNA-directed RNA polymerase subunit M/transcription elongation factor TFIIS